MSHTQAQDLTDQSPPRDVCGYEFVRWLKAGRTALCRSDQGRAIVLKSIGEDCLLEGQLHPDIKERLARIRELPHRTVATLISVERDRQGGVWAIWEYIEGTTFQTWTCDPMRDDRHVARMLRELVIAVESMHGQGIVHGAIHDGNVLIDTNGEVRLLDVSPLLFSEEREDVSAISSFLEAILKCRCRDEKTQGQGTLLSQISAQGDLRQLSATISRAIQSCDQVPDTAAIKAADAAEEKMRRRAMRWALMSAAAALLLGIIAWLAFSDFGRAPPQAPAEALEKRGP